MADFMIRFFICNIVISGIIGILFALKRLFKNSLSGRLQYNLWFLLLGLLAVPFLPLRSFGSAGLLSFFHSPQDPASANAGTAAHTASGAAFAENTGWMNDFVSSVNSETPSIAGYILLGIWIAGILAMILLVGRSALRLRALKKSALPLQNAEVRRLYERCCQESGITKAIPVYSTAFLKSPIFTGFRKPGIYLPIHLISDHQESQLRYMLLHELQHYRHRDALSGYLMCLAGVLYWFHPLVWYALREMHHDREIACDTSVLKLLEEDLYEDYGNTLITFAQRVAFSPYPFTAGLGGNMKQMKRRILNIASYQKPSRRKKAAGLLSFALIAVCLISLAPFVSTYAADNSDYRWETASGKISREDYSQYFGDYEGSFVLYDLKSDAWSIHDMERATQRVAPNSTYKIYMALFGLEEGVISPDDSLLAWDGETYSIEAWNTDQTLDSAMNASVNWYFQAIDRQLGADRIQSNLKEIGYGNETFSGDLSSYWMESSLKISPVEQVELLTRLEDGSLGFAPENVSAVKDSIRLLSSAQGTLYGKTGTGQTDGQNTNGWFIGFIETSDNTYLFATNIRSARAADGVNATEITLSILDDMGIWSRN